MLVLGAGLATLLQWAGTVRPWLPAVLAALAAALVLLSAVPLTERRQGRYFPGPSAAEVVANIDGCVITDMPMTLIQMNVLRRNIDRGWRYEVDLGGVSYHLPAGPAEDRPRSRNLVWQNYAMEYLRSGTAVVIARFSSGEGFSPQTFRVIQSWPEIGRADRYVIRRPQP